MVYNIGYTGSNYFASKSKRANNSYSLAMPNEVYTKNDLQFTRLTLATNSAATNYTKTLPRSPYQKGDSPYGAKVTFAILHPYRSGEKFNF